MLANTLVTKPANTFTWFVRHATSLLDLLIGGVLYVVLNHLATLMAITKMEMLASLNPSPSLRCSCRSCEIGHETQRRHGLVGPAAQAHLVSKSSLL